MIMIIDNYATPAHRIKEFLYKSRSLRPFCGEAGDDAVYFVHSECVEDADHYRHLAEEIVEVWGNRLVVLNKRRRHVVFYRIEGKEFVREDAPQNAPSDGHHGHHLPHLLAQEDVVTFPSDGDE